MLNGMEIRVACPLCARPYPRAPCGCHPIPHVRLAVVAPGEIVGLPCGPFSTTSDQETNLAAMLDEIDSWALPPAA